MKRYFRLLLPLVMQPLAWLYVIVSVALLGAAIHFRSDKHIDMGLPIIVSERPIIDNKEQLAVFADDSQPVQIRLSRLIREDKNALVSKKIAQSGSNTVHITSEEILEVVATLDGLDFPTNVEAIDGGGVGDMFLPRISEMTSLKRLEMPYSYQDKPVDLGSLANLQDLEILDLGTMFRITTLAPLQELPKLHTLRIGHHGLMKKERMAEIAQLPALRNLYLPDVTQFEFSRQAITELQNSKTLQSIYVPISVSDRAALASIQSQVPGISVQSSRYSLYRLLVFGVAIWFAFMSSWLGIHIAGQFSMPHAELVPRFKSIHQTVAWCLILGVVIVVSSVVCGMAGGRWFAVLASISAAVVLGVRPSLNTYDPTSVSKLSVIVRVGVLVLLVAIFFWFVRNPLVAETYLANGYPMVAAALIGIAAVAAVSIRHRLNGLCRDRYAAGRPLYLSLRDLQDAVKEGRLSDNSDFQVAYDVYERNQKFMRGLGLVMVGFVVLRQVAGDRLFGTTGAGAMLRGQIVAGFFFVAFFGMFLIAVRWWQRMPYLASMIARPPSRLNQINQVIQGVAREFAHFSIPVFIAGWILAVNTPMWATDSLVARTIASVMFLVGAIAVCYASTLWMLMIRSTVRLIVFWIALQSIITFGIALLTLLGLRIESGIPAYRVVISALVMFALSYIAVRFARRQFTRFEWGTLL